MFSICHFVLRTGQNYPAAGACTTRGLTACAAESRTGQGVREQCLDRARRHFSYRHGMAPGPRKGADMLFPQHEAAVAGAVPGRQWPEENNLMTQEYAEMSTGRGDQ